MILLLSLLVTGCRPSDAEDSGYPEDPSPAYDAGWEAGCDLGKEDGRACQPADESVLSLLGDDYARGLVDGYAECRIVWYELRGCGE